MLENMCLTPFGGTPTLFCWRAHNNNKPSEQWERAEQGPTVKGGAPKSFPDRGWTSQQLKIGMVAGGCSPCSDGGWENAEERAVALSGNSSGKGGGCSYPGQTRYTLEYFTVL